MNLLHTISCMQEIRSSNLKLITGICDPNKFRVRHDRSLKLDWKLQYLNFIENIQRTKNTFHETAD